MSLHHDPVSGFTSHEPDHHALTRVRKAESEIVAHVWGVYMAKDRAEVMSRMMRKMRRHCPSCARPTTSLVVDTESREITVKGATAVLHVVVLRHLRS